jgi:hypothetical protein
LLHNTYPRAFGFEAVTMKPLFAAPKGRFKSLFAPKTAAPAAPQPVRKPTITDPDVAAAAQRTRESALKRKGRLSTILTDQTNDVVGSSGQKLGA